jgi:UDP:flavonoid glycosyltransferase YjiC (YdhE family)
LLGDQPANAARITAAGAGVRLPKEASPTAIGEAVRRVLDDQRYRRAAQGVAAALAHENPKESTVAELESLVGGQGR